MLELRYKRCAYFPRTSRKTFFSGASQGESARFHDPPLPLSLLDALLNLVHQERTAVSGIRIERGW